MHLYVFCCSASKNPHQNSFMVCRKTLIQELSREEARRQPSAAEWLADQDAQARAKNSLAESVRAEGNLPISEATNGPRPLPPL